MTVSTEPRALDHANSLANDLKGTNWDSIDIYEWLEDSLAITAKGKRELGGDWIVTGYELLLGYGGPNIYLNLGLDGWGVVEVHWASDSATRQVGQLDQLLSAIQELEAS